MELGYYTDRQSSRPKPQPSPCYSVFSKLERRSQIEEPIAHQASRRAGGAHGIRRTFTVD